MNNENPSPTNEKVVDGVLMRKSPIDDEFEPVPAAEMTSRLAIAEAQLRSLREKYNAAKFPPPPRITLASIWKQLTSKPLDEQPQTISFPEGYTGRRLIDGRYVLESYKPGKAVDLSAPYMEHPPCSSCYDACIADDARALIEAAPSVLARRGI